MEIICFWLTARIFRSYNSERNWAFIGDSWESETLKCVNNEPSDSDLIDIIQEIIKWIMNCKLQRKPHYIVILSIDFNLILSGMFGVL